METHRDPAVAQPADPQTLRGDPADPSAHEPSDAESLAEPLSEEQIAEEERTHRVIPRVAPRTTDDLEIEPPQRQRYPVRLGHALSEMWATRELLLTFVERDLRVRYKQAVLGGLWAILQPLLLMVIFTVVFGHIARVPHQGVPYPIFSYSTLVPWGFFSGAIAYATNAIITNAPVIRKTSCPREHFAISSVLSSGFDYLMSLLILLPMLLYYGLHHTGTLPACGNCLPGRTWLAFPVLLAILLMLMTAVTLVVSAATVYFRDLRYAVPMLLQILLYGTPIAYPMGKIQQALGGRLGRLYPYLNPLAPVMDGFRRIFALGWWPQWVPVASAGAVSAVAVFLSYWWYKRIDRNFADVI